MGSALTMLKNVIKQTVNCPKNEQTTGNSGRHQLTSNLVICDSQKPVRIATSANVSNGNYVEHVFFLRNIHAILPLWI